MLVLTIHQFRFIPQFLGILRNELYTAHVRIVIKRIFLTIFSILLPIIIPCHLGNRMIHIVVTQKN